MPRWILAFPLIGTPSFLGEMADARNSWPIIVGGFYRSGTSLVRRLLNSHSRIHCGPEVKFFKDFYGDYIDDPLRHARFAATASSILPESDVLAILGHAFIAIHEAACARIGKARWADKVPENSLYLDDWQQLLGDHWLFLHVARNPLDTIASFTRHPMKQVIPRDIRARARLYRQHHESALNFRELYPTRYHCLLYESLVQAPQDVLVPLMRWLGEEFEPGQLSFNRYPHPSGLEDPKAGSRKEIDRASLYTWPQLLAKDDAATIWAATSDIWAELADDSALVERFAHLRLE